MRAVLDIRSRIILDGNLNGSVTRGTYQTKASELLNSMGNQKTRGLKEPTGGTLIIGDDAGLSAAASEVRDFRVQDVVLKKNVTALSAGFGPADLLDPGTQTVLSTDKLNAAGLSNLKIYSNTTLTTDADAQIKLNPGGSFTAVARRIVHQGGITTPGGSVNLALMDNVTTFEQIYGSANPLYVPLETKIVLASGSSIDVAGTAHRQFDFLRQHRAVNNFSHIGGGSVSLADQTLAGKGIDFQTGAHINVSGGYGIDQKGTVTGGDAGKVTLMGSTILLRGNLAGYSLVGNKGGSIQLVADTVEVRFPPRRKTRRTPAALFSGRINSTIPVLLKSIWSDPRGQFRCGYGPFPLRDQVRPAQPRRHS